jgi:hypothetical protein
MDGGGGGGGGGGPRGRPAPPPPINPPPPPPPPVRVPSTCAPQRDCVISATAEPLPPPP